MSLWITSDTHFSHENIIKYENRPFLTVQDMNESLIARWNSHVKPFDIVYHLGDFGLGKSEDMRLIRQQLNGYITLIRGNHDDSLSKLISTEFNSIANELTLQYKQWLFIMTHQPKSDIMFDENNHGVINLHGHIHGKNRATNNRINVSCDAWDFTPVTFDDLLMEYRKQRKST